ncbi:MAG: sulfatase-like hydrolase/transferase [Deltaproteobacteria bacterium]|nr:sulfatase-like hydrolase/transferase [Deltaproteobacteria bacterium]
MSARAKLLHRFLNVWFVVVALGVVAAAIWARFEVREQGYTESALLGVRGFTLANAVEETRRTTNVLGFFLGLIYLLARRLCPGRVRLARSLVILAVLAVFAAWAGVAYYNSTLDEDLNNIYGQYVDVETFFVRTVTSSLTTSPPAVRTGMVFAFCAAMAILLLPAAFIEKWIFRKPSPPFADAAPRKAIWIGALVVGLAVNVFAARGNPRPADATHPDVILVSIDTLRADHLEMYGYGRATSPHLVEFAKDAVVVEHHLAHAPWTVPTHMSMFTGVIPSGHGVSSPVASVDPRRTLFPELLKDGGYRNGAFVTNILLGASYGYSAGFDLYVLNPNWNAAEVSTQALNWFLGSKTPTFLFLHMFDVHYPYTPPEEYWGRFAPKNPTVYEMQKENFYTFFTWIREQGEPEREATKAQYDEEIVYTDAQLGRFFEKLKGAGRYDNAWIIVTSDHGEEFAERGLWGHGITLYNEMLRVPLIVKAPGNACAGSRLTDGIVPQTAIYNLVTRAAAVTSPDSEELRCGPDGVPKILRDLVTTEPVISEADMLGPLRMSATSLDKKLIEPTKVHVKGILDFERPFEAYDLAADPAEQTNLIDGVAPADLAARLREFAPEHRKAMCRVRSQDSGQAKTGRLELDEATIQKLISLGYINPGGESGDKGLAGEDCLPADAAP